MSKIQYESKSQPGSGTEVAMASFYQYVKDTIWKQITTCENNDETNLMFLSICQRYNMKANHN